MATSDKPQTENKGEERRISISAGEDVKRGVYSNHTIVSHTAEEFQLDFLNISQAGGTLNARVITSPAHMKRIIQTLSDNIAKYEKTHGEIVEGKSVSGGDDKGNG